MGGHRWFWDELETPCEPDPRLAELTPGQRAAYALWWAYSEIGNGGLHQYFYNSTGYLLLEAIIGAELVGEVELASELRKAASHMGNPYPRNRDARWKRLGRLPGPDDRLWNDLDDAVYPPLEAVIGSGLRGYIRGHPDQFFKQ